MVCCNWPSGRDIRYSFHMSLGVMGALMMFVVTLEVIAGSREALHNLHDLFTVAYVGWLLVIQAIICDYKHNNLLFNHLLSVIRGMAIILLNAAFILSFAAAHISSNVTRYSHKMD